MVVIGLSCQTGPCSCASCSIASDSFNRADNSNINTGAPVTWNTVSGVDWQISTDFLFDDDTDGMVICATGHPDSIASCIIQVDLTGTADGDQPRVIVGANSASSPTTYYFAQVTIGATGCLALYKHSSGSDTLLAEVTLGTSDYPTTQTLKVYFDGHTSGLFQATMGTVVVTADCTGATGIYTGLGTGTIAGSVLFQNWSFLKYHQSDTAASCQQGELCTLGGDTGDFPNGSLGCGWSVAAGTANYSSSVIAITASNSKVPFQVPNPTAGAMMAVAQFSIGNSADQPRIYVGSNSSLTSGWYAQITNTTSLEIFTESGTKLAGVNFTAISTGTYYWLQACLNAGVLSASLGPVGGPAISTAHAVTVPGSKSYAGLGSGSITSGVNFKNFTLNRCPTCATPSPQGPCDTGCCAAGDSTMTVIIPTGLTDKSSCTLCSGVAGTYVCTGGPCTYKYCDASACAGTNKANCATDGGPYNTYCGGPSGDTGGCNGTSIIVEILVDSENNCYLLAMIQAVSSFDVSCLYLLASASYISASPINPCSRTPITLNLGTGSGCPGGVNSEATAFGCNGSWPATITVQSGP